MIWGQAEMTDTELGTKFLELRIIKLLVIIRHYGIWDIEVAYDIGPDEGCDLRLGYSCKWLSLGPLCKVIYCYYCKFGMSLAQGEGSNQVNTPLSKQLWCRD